MHRGEIRRLILFPKTMKLPSSQIIKVPTDLEILNTIYELHHKDFVLYDQDKEVRETKIMVPINCRDVAEILKVDGYIVFGRLYYHLEKSTATNGTMVLELLSLN